MKRIFLGLAIFLSIGTNFMITKGIQWTGNKLVKWPKRTSCRNFLKRAMILIGGEISLMSSTTQKSDSHAQILT